MTTPAVTENTFFNIGGIAFPLATNTGNSLLQDVDPVIYRILDFYAQTIVLNLGARWNEQVILAGRPDLQNLDFFTVGESTSYPVPGLLQENQYRFPLLQVYREKETYLQRSNAWYTVEGEIKVIFTLPPITSEQYEYLYPFLGGVSKCIIDRTFMGYDDKYNNGQVVIGPDGYIELVRMHGAEFGELPGASTTLMFPSIMISYQFNERRNPSNENFETFNGFDGYVNLNQLNYNNDGYSGPIIDFTEIHNDTPAAISGIVPNFGPSAGGTFFILQGQGFLQAAQITIGGYTVTSFKVKTDTVITGFTSLTNAGTYDVVVILLDQTTATLPAAFTFI